MNTKKRLDRLYKDAERICIDRQSKIVLMSDCHRGTGTHGDNFLKNRNIVYAALKSYLDKGFSYMEIGDGDELWENRRPNSIILAHKDIFCLMREFYCSGRFCMLYGNHDRAKEKESYMKKHYEGYLCDCSCMMEPLFPGIVAREALVLQDGQNGHEIFLVHGHQGDFFNDVLWRLAAFLARFLWKRLELIGFQDPTSAAKNYRRKNKTERRLSSWAKQNRVLLVAGHTHRPMLPKPGESFYANDGSCVHPENITAIEIENGCMTLVKWNIKPRTDKSLYVAREIIEGPVKIRDYYVGSKSKID